MVVLGRISRPSGHAGHVRTCPGTTWPTAGDDLAIGQRSRLAGSLSETHWRRPRGLPQLRWSLEHRKPARQQPAGAGAAAGSVMRPTVLLQKVPTVAISPRLMAMEISASSPQMACLYSARLMSNRTSSARLRPAKPRNPSQLFVPLLAWVIEAALFAHGATRAFSSRTRALVQHAV